MQPLKKPLLINYRYHLGNRYPFISLPFHRLMHQKFNINTTNWLITSYHIISFHCITRNLHYATSHLSWHYFSTATDSTLNNCRHSQTVQWAGCWVDPGWHNADCYKSDWNCEVCVTGVTGCQGCRVAGPWGRRAGPWDCSPADSCPRPAVWGSDWRWPGALGQHAAGASLSVDCSTTDTHRSWR